MRQPGTRDQVRLSLTGPNETEDPLRAATLEIHSSLITQVQFPSVPVSHSIMLLCLSPFVQSYRVKEAKFKQHRISISGKTCPQAECHTFRGVPP